MKKNGFHNISDLDSVYDTSIPRSRGESTRVMHVLDARDESYEGYIFRFSCTKCKNVWKCDSRTNQGNCVDGYKKNSKSRGLQESII
jgi:hypothetical protein